jgi:hypothetical protein
MRFTGLFLVGSVGDPDPEADPYVFGPPGSESVSTRYGSGKNSKKNFHSSCFQTFLFFYL